MVNNSKWSKSLGVVAALAMYLFMTPSASAARGGGGGHGGGGHAGGHGGEHHGAEHHGEEHHGEAHRGEEHRNAEHRGDDHNRHPYQPARNHFDHHDDHFDHHADHFDHHFPDWHRGGWGPGFVGGGWGPIYTGWDTGWDAGDLNEPVNNIVNNTTNESPDNDDSADNSGNDNGNSDSDDDRNADQQSGTNNSGNANNAGFATDSWPELGVVTYSGEYNGSQGQVIMKVTPGSAAEKAGFVSGDVILTLNGAPVPNANMLDEALNQANGKFEAQVWDSRTNRKSSLTGSFNPAPIKPGSKTTAFAPAK